MSFTLVPIVGTFVAPGGGAATGRIVFRPTARMRNGSITVPSSTTATLMSGAIPDNFELAATDDTGTSPSNVKYEVTEYITGAPVRAYLISIPNTSASIDLATVPSEPVIANAGVYQPLSQKGQPNGYAGLDADGLVPTEQLPAGLGGGGGGVTDHGALTGLSDDDHVQYMNTTRGDARYSLTGHTHTGFASSTHNHDSSYSGTSHTHDTRYYTETETDSLLGAKASTSALTSHTGNIDNPHEVTKAQLGLGNVNNTSDASKPISTATQTALDAKAADSAVVHNTGAETVAGVKTFSSSPIVPTPTTGTQAVNKTYADGLVSGGAPDATTSTKGIVQLAGALGGTAALPTVPALDTHVANTSNPHSVTKTQVGLGNVDNTADTAKPVSTAQQTALDLKAPLASPAFTGTPTGITKSHVGLGNVDNTADSAKPVSTAQQTALDLKAPLASPAFTGTPTGITKTHVGLGNVDNTSDASKPVSTATQTALDGKQPLDSDLTTIAGLTATTDNFMVAASSAWASRTPTQARTSLGIGANVSLTDAATVAIDASLGNKFKVTLAGNRTLGNPTNAYDGQVILINVLQDATGSRTVTLDTKYRLPTGVTLTWSTTASKKDKLLVQYDSTADKFDVLAFQAGY